MHAWKMYRGSTRKRLCVVLLGLALTACPSQEPLCEEAPQTVASPQGTFPLGGTNGTKVKAVGTSLHAVYVDGGAIKYMSSENAVLWTSPVVVSTGLAGCETPSLTVDGSGALALAFVCGNTGASGGTLLYTFKAPDASSWSSPVQLATSAFHPSITSHGTDTYAVWAHPGSIAYVSFPTLEPPGGASGRTLVEDPPCAGLTSAYSFPAIAVIPSPGGSGLLARVAYLKYLDDPGCSGAAERSMGVYIVDACPTCSLAYVYTEVRPVQGTHGTAVGLSLAGDASGNFLLTWSLAVDERQVSKLAHGTGSGTWHSVSLLGPSQQAISHVIAYGQGGQFRLAWTDLRGSDSYGATYVRDGSWEGEALAPTWKGESTLLADAARDPQALLWERCIDGTQRCTLSALYEEAGKVQSNYGCCSVPSCSP